MIEYELKFGFECRTKLKLHSDSSNRETFNNFLPVFRIVIVVIGSQKDTPGKINENAMLNQINSFEINAMSSKWKLADF